MTPLLFSLAAEGVANEGDIVDREWLAVALLAALAILSFAVYRYWRTIELKSDRITAALFGPPKAKVGIAQEPAPGPALPDVPTAILFVEGYDALGVESLLTVGRMFPGAFPQLILASARPHDADDEEGRSVRHILKRVAERSLRKYSGIAELFDTRLVEVRVGLGPSVLGLKVKLARELALEFARPVFFCPSLDFQPVRWYHRFLEPEGARHLARRLQAVGFVAVDVLIPATVRESHAPRRNVCRV